MKRHNFIMILTMILFLTWSILNQNFTIEYMFAGLLISLAILLVSERYISDSSMPNIEIKYLLTLFKYAFKVIFLMYASSFKIMKAIILRDMNISIIKVSLPTKQDFVNALVCNSITLVPGTITIDKIENEALVLAFNPENKSTDFLKEEIESKFEKLKN